MGAQNTGGETMSKFAGGMDAASQTASGAWSTFKDTVSQGLGTLFAPLLTSMTDVLNFVSNSLIPGIGGFVDTLKQWKTPIMIIGGIIGAFFLPLLVAWAAQMVITAATTIASFIAMSAQAVIFAAIMAIQWIIAFWPVFLVIAIVLALVAVIWYFWDEIKAALSKAWDWVVTVFTGIWEAITGAFQAVWDTIKPVWDTLWNLLTLPIRIWWTIISAVFQLAWAGIKWVFDTIAGFVIPIWNRVWDTVKNAFQAVMDWIMPKFTAVKDFIVDVFTKVKDKVTSIWDAITGVIQKAVDVIKGIGEGIWNGLKGVINTGIRLINSAIGGFNSIIGAVNKVPGVNVPTIPTIPTLAEGGIVTRPTLAVVGEAGPEAVVPLDRYRRGETAGPTQVRVFIGERELTDIVRVEVREADDDTARLIAAGRGMMP